MLSKKYTVFGLCKSRSIPINHTLVALITNDIVARVHCIRLWPKFQFCKKLQDEGFKCADKHCVQTIIIAFCNAASKIFIITIMVATRRLC